jgi:hypothetical protein
MRAICVRSRLQYVCRWPETAAGQVPHIMELSGIERGRDLPVLCGAFVPDETLVVDSRTSLRPAQLVERKLMSLLKNVYMPVSQVRTTTLYKGRGPFSAFTSVRATVIPAADAR